MPDYGPESGIYKSIDGGVHWTRLSGGGWPAGELGRIGLAAAHVGNATRLYAVVDAEKDGGLYRSDDAGAHWQRVNDDGELVNGYFSRLTVMPGDPDTVFAMGRSIHRCDQGGTPLHDHQGLARRRRLPRPVDQPAASATHDHRLRPGHGGQRRRRRHLEQLVQPADRTALPPRRRQPFAVLDLRRTTGQRHRRDRQPHRLRRDHLARLASGRRRRARLRHPRSARSGHRLRLGPRRPPVALECAQRRSAEHLAMAGVDLRRAPGDGEVPLHLDHADRRVAACAVSAVPGRAGAVPLARSGATWTVVSPDVAPRDADAQGLRCGDRRPTSRAPAAMA